MVLAARFLLSRRVARAAIVLTVLTAFVVAPTPRAEAITVPATLYHERPVQAGPVAPTFAIDFVGVAFDLPAGLDRHEAGHDVAVRFRHGGAWGRWQAVGEDGAQAEGTFTGALVSAQGAEAYQVRGVPAGAGNARAAALNTTDGAPRVIGYRQPGTAHAVTACKSRAEWGADETIRRGVPVFAPLQIVTVHHTAQNNADVLADPDAQVRAAYEWHVTGNNWDDIGYQALIGPDGTVYEGRWSGTDSLACSAGGTGADFGHEGDGSQPDARMVTGAHVGGYNTGNFGVALLGTYTDVAPAGAQRAALVDYLTELTGRHGLDPQGTVGYDNGTNSATTAAIGGHRDLGSTECPGGMLYADLPAIRADVAGTAPDGGTASDGVAVSETTAHGTATGDFRATHVADGTVQTLAETETGGRPSQRVSRLEHVWTVAFSGATSPTLTMVADASLSADGDGFAVRWSADGGASYTEAFTIPAGGGGTFQATLPQLAAGQVLVQVVDTDRSRGNRIVDTLSVDLLGLTGDGAPPSGDDGTTGGDAGTQTIELAAVGSKQKGWHLVDLAWTGMAGEIVVTRDGVEVHRGIATTYRDEPGAKGAATYGYQVCAVTDGSACSDVVTVTF